MGDLKLKTLHFNDYEDFIDKICESYEKYYNEEDFYDISIVAHYDVIIELLNKFIKTTNFNMKNIQIEDPDVADYFDEWIMSITSDKEIWVEKAKHEPSELSDGGYLFSDSSITFIHNDASYGFVKQNPHSNLVAFDFKFEQQSDKNTEKDINDKYITVKCDINPHEAHEIIKEMDKCIDKLDDAFARISKNLSSIFD